LSSGLVGFFEKRKLRSFLLYVADYDRKKPETYFKGKTLDKVTMRQLYDEYGLDISTQAFIGHAMALHRDDSYVDQPAEPTVEAIQLYAYSMERYGKSPYIYPIYGLGGLPEGFSRVCAIHGGTFMLNKGIDEILFDGTTAWGVRTGNEYAKARYIIGDPSYFNPSLTRITGRVVRSICFLDHPIANTDNAESVQIVIPATTVKRRNDVYVCAVSHAHNVAAPGKYIAIVSTTVETADPIRELESGFMLLGKIMERFDSISDLYEPVNDGRANHCYISKSYDASSHFETAANDVLDLYERITGEKLDMTISADSTNEDE
jgi:Rab GDP dissociation inhibitor